MSRGYNPAWLRSIVIVIVVVIAVIVLFGSTIFDNITSMLNTTTQLSSSSTICALSRDGEGTPGWVATFTNTTSSDIRVIDFTVLFFDPSGTQTGSVDGSPVASFTVAAGNSYTARSDETGGYSSILSPVPPNSATCRVTGLMTSPN